MVLGEKTDARVTGIIKEGFARIFPVHGQYIEHCSFHVGRGEQLILDSTLEEGFRDPRGFLPGV